MEINKSLRTVRTNANNRIGTPAFSALSLEIRSQIGSKLRILHEDIVTEGIPERFLELLARLDKGAN